MELHEITNQMPSEQPLFDPALLESIPKDAATLLENSYDWLTYLIGELEKARAESRGFREQLADLNLAMAEYANETGQGAMFNEGIQLCLNVVRQRKR